MELKRLQLNNHRNYAHLDLVPGPAVNVFVGANGQGKTNLLEAVAMLALSSSPRARRDQELLGPVTPAARIHAEVESAGRGLEVTITLQGRRTSTARHRGRRCPPPWLRPAGPFPG